MFPAAKLLANVQILPATTQITIYQPLAYFTSIWLVTRAVFVPHFEAYADSR